MESYLEKILETEPYLVSKTGSVEPTVRLLDVESLAHEKIASEALSYATSVPKEPGKTSILVLAMGSSEYYGPNRNGDAFRESELKKHHHTFETNANVFKSHVNKDPAKAIGKVIKSFYNDEMRRVEIILQLDDALCPDIVSKIRDKRDVAVSMGCRIKFDVCSICGNKAPTRAQYCKHLRYEMNEIYPDGRVVCADNPSPNFFDISVVYRPADKTGYMMKKVAFDGARSTGLKSADLAIKAAGLTVLAKYLNKAADIDKTIVGAAVGVDSDTPTLDSNEKDLSVKWIKTLTPKVVASYRSIGDDNLQDLSTIDLSESIKLLSDNGIFLMTPEFLDLVFMRLSGEKAPGGLAQKLVSLQSDILELLSKYPEIPESVFSSGALDPDSSVEDLDIDSRDKLAGHTRVPSSTALDEETFCKIAGIAAISNSAYIAKLVGETSGGMAKVAMSVNPECTPRESLGMNKLSYLRHRTSDMLVNHCGILKMSSRNAVSDINLFKSDPNTYFTLVGRELLYS